MPRTSYKLPESRVCGYNVRMIVLVADKFEESGLMGLQNLGVEVLSEPDLKDAALESRIKATGCEVLIVRSTKVTASMIEGSTLKLIIRAGAGYNTIDVKAATANGVKVANCPGKNAAAVAELAFGLIIALDRFIPDNVSELRAQKWNKKAFSKGRGLCGRSLGLIGLGNIGKEVARRAQAFGLEIYAYSKSLSDADAQSMNIKRVDLESVAGCDIISVHCALNDQTRGMLDAGFFEKVKPGAMFINTSRAEVVDQAALMNAVKTKGVRAGLDVFDDEPTDAVGSYTGELCTAENVYCTHHIGASTEQAQEAVADETVRIVKVFRETGIAPNAVN